MASTLVRAGNVICVRISFVWIIFWATGFFDPGPVQSAGMFSNPQKLRIAF